MTKPVDPRPDDRPSEARECASTPDEQSLLPPEELVERLNAIIAEARADWDDDVARGLETGERLDLEEPECEVALSLLSQAASALQTAGDLMFSVDRWRSAFVKAHARAQAAEAKIKSLREALAGFDDDFMTSEQHHPKYVLIPVEVFERVRLASLAISQEGRGEDGR